jgi:hypothetical protein
MKMAQKIALKTLLNYRVKIARKFESVFAQFSIFKVYNFLPRFFWARLVLSFLVFLALVFLVLCLL